MEDSQPVQKKVQGETALGLQVYDHIKLRLLEGDLEPGDDLSVVAFAEQLGCSRVPVMEAMKRLETEGLINIIPQVGCRVAVPNGHDAMDFFVLFSGVEGVMARFAAERRSEEDLEMFRTVCDRVDTLIASAGKPESKDPSYRQLNLLFHRAIHEMAHSPLTSCISVGLWDRADFYIKAAFGSLYFSSRVKRAHQAIRRAIIAGDAEKAELEVRANLKEVGERVAKKLC